MTADAIRENSLLQDFEQSCELMEGDLVARYGATKARLMRSAASCEFESLVPEIPHIPGRRAVMLNTFLQITAQELAVYKGLKKLGMAPAEIWQICHAAIRKRAALVPTWKRWIMKQLMFSKPVGKMMSRRAANHEVGRFGGFEIEYLAADGASYDLGVNYRSCGNYDFVMKHGGEEFAPYVCMSDIALSEAFGWGLVRTQTLADGCDHCDFRMSKNGHTCITSKTPAVQQTVDLISAQEAAGSAGAPFCALAGRDKERSR